MNISDLPPHAQVCWDRDGVPEFVERGGDGWTIMHYGEDGRDMPFGWIVQLQLPIEDRALPHTHGGWMVYVEDPVPRWITGVEWVYHGRGRAK